MDDTLSITLGLNWFTNILVLVVKTLSKVSEKPYILSKSIMFETQFLQPLWQSSKASKYTHFNKILSVFTTFNQYFIILIYLFI